MQKLSLTALGVSAALATAIAGAALAPRASAEEVKCYGVAKAGENDCANQAAGHSCAGQSKVDFDGMDFKAIEKAACMEMGGTEEPFEGVNQNVKM